MIIDYDIIKKSYFREFDLITKLYLKQTFPNSLIFHGPKESGKRFCNNGLCLIFKPSS